MRGRRSNRAVWVAGVPIAAALMGLAACSSSGVKAPASVTAGVASSGSSSSAGVNGGGRQIVYFGQTAASSYVVAEIAAVKAEAARLGFKITVVQDSDDTQPTQDAQVRQYLASGKKPAAFLIQTANGAAAVNSVRLLSKVAPVIQGDSAVASDEAPYVKAYAGQDNEQIGRNAGQLLTALRTKLVGEGVKLHSTQGNLLTLNFPAGFQGGIDRSTGLNAATASSPFNLLNDIPGNYFDAQDGFAGASQVLPKYVSDVDFIFVGTSSAGVGVAKALADSGLTLNKNVWMVAGNCSGGLSTMASVYGATMQSAAADGRIQIDVVAQYLATGKTKPGTYLAPPTATAPIVTATPPAATSIMPLKSVVGETQAAGATIWDSSPAAVCA
ncbi:substrate-binding domain-containing protein [Jatrophihabitans sp. DSM 45814]